MEWSDEIPEPSVPAEQVCPGAPALLLQLMASLIGWLTRSNWRSFVVIFLLAFAIRGFFLTKVPDRYIVPHNRWEMEAVATSLAVRGEFADPYIVPTGATAHLPPIMPGILAMIWKVFGMGVVAGYAGWLFRIATFAAMYAMMPWFAGRLGLGRPAGLLGGIAGSFIALWPGHGEALTAIALGLLMVAFLRRWTSGSASLGGSLLLGLGAGVAFHLQPALLPVVLGWMVFELSWSRERRKWIRSLVTALGILVACLPWGVRNYATFGELFFIRSNLGLELRMGNHEGAAATMEMMDRQQEPIHPRTHEGEALKLREVGEVEYMRGAGREAMAWIRAHPYEFVRLTLSRVAHFWFGPLHDPKVAFGFTALTILAVLGAWRVLPTLAVPQRAALLIPLLTYPLIYYVVAYMSRYRIPIDWILLMFAGAAVWNWMKSGAMSSEEMQSE